MEHLLDHLKANWKAIILCTIVSALVWVFNALNKSYSTKIKYPLEFKVRTGNVVALVPPPSFVELRVTGKGWYLLRKTLGIGVEPISLEITDPTRIKYLTTSALLHSLQENLKDLKINSFVRDTLYFVYNVVTSKDVVVRIRKKDISLQQGYRLTSDIKVEPEIVTFKGASSLIGRLPDTLYAEIEEKHISESFSNSVNIHFPRHHLLIPTVEKVNVSFSVEAFVRKNMTLPLSLHNFPRDSSVVPRERSAMVQYYVSEGRERDISPESLRVVVDFERLNLIDSTIQPQLFSPVKLTDIIISPSRIRVKYAEDRNNRRNRNR